MLKDRMNFHIKNFTKVDHKIYEYLINNSTTKMPQNISKAAEAIEVSTSAITRFCQKIKLDGWNELLFIVKYETIPMKKSRTDNAMINDIIYSLSRTEDTIDKNALKLIVKNILKSEYIYIYGESFTELAGIQFARKLNKIGITSQVLNIASDLAFVMPKENSVHIMISMSGMNPNIKAATKKLRHQEKTPQKIFAIGSTKYSNVVEEVNAFIGGEFYQTAVPDPYELPNISGYIILYILNKIFDEVYMTNVDKFKAMIQDIAKEKIR